MVESEPSDVVKQLHCIELLQQSFRIILFHFANFAFYDFEFGLNTV
jgi:hypothetical protein